MAVEVLAYEAADPLERQLANFCSVLRGEAAPLVSGAEGLATLRVIEAVKEAARRGERVRVE